MTKVIKFSKFNESVKFGKYDIPDEEVLYKDSDFFIKYDNYPVSPGHILIITNGKEETFFDLSESKKMKLIDLINESKKMIEKDYDPDGYNIGMNCGVSAGQTIMQFHCHLIPRYEGDVPDPTGGVRHSVMGKGFYKPK